MRLVNIQTKLKSNSEKKNDNIAAMSSLYYKETVSIFMFKNLNAFLTVKTRFLT